MPTIVGPVLYVTPDEVAARIVHYDCPSCQVPVVLTLPRFSEIVRAGKSIAIELGLTRLTPTERLIFDMLAQRSPAVMPMPELVAELDMSPVALRVHAYRMRPKLAAHGYRVELRQGMYYLFGLPAKSPTT